MAKNIIHARLAEGPHKGEDFIIYRIKTIPQDIKMPVEMERLQFPVRLSFGITANKSQGQSYEFVGIDLTHHFFTHGQAYVAKSRVGSSKLVKIYQPPNCCGHLFSYNITGSATQAEKYSACVYEDYR